MTENKDAANWAKPIDKLAVSGDLPAEAINLNVEGRRLAGLAGGFGKMWQKTYRVSLAGTGVTPAEAIKAWKENFQRFWPAGNRFFGALTGISPGDVALLNLSMPGKVKMSTGIMVVYADDESFSFMTPEGHMFNGMVTFSAFAQDGATIVQAQALIRAQDPFYEMGMAFGGHRKEDRFWEQTLENLAAHLGAPDAKATTQRVCVDRKRQWRQARNIRHNAALRSGAYMFRLRRRPKRKDADA
jgi:hypothetical protein